MTRHDSKHSRSIFTFGHVWAGDTVFEEVEEVRK